MNSNKQVINLSSVVGDYVIWATQYWYADHGFGHYRWVIFKKGSVIAVGQSGGSGISEIITAERLDQHVREAELREDWV